MKKTLLQLTTREFVALLLGYSPKQEYKVTTHVGNYKYENVYSGSHDQLIDSLPSALRQSAEEGLFDYRLHLDMVDVFQYLGFRTKDFEPDLASVFIHDMEEHVTSLLEEAKESIQDEGKFESWKSRALDRYKKALSYLQGKCKSDSSSIITPASEHARVADGADQSTVASSKKDGSNPILSIPELAQAVNDQMIDPSGKLLVYRSDFIRYCVSKGFFKPYNAMRDWSRIDELLVTPGGKKVTKKMLRQSYQDLQKVGKV